MRYESTIFFIKRCKEIHGNEYDYSLTNYIKWNKKVIVSCKIHGNFKKIPARHIFGEGCPKCSTINRIQKRKSNKNELIKRFEKIHNCKYDYSLMKYINTRTKITIVCQYHGEFKQTPDNHLKYGCAKCANNIKKTKKDWIILFNKKHNYKYNYKFDKSFDSKTKITIVCQYHGEFKQTPDNHLSKSQGCPICNLSKGELQIKEYLENNNINFKSQHTFENCKYKRLLKFDFYLPDGDMCIEYDGIQHFKPIEYFGGKSHFNYVKKLDSIKNKYCEINNINLIRIPYYENIENSMKNILNK